MCSLRCRLTSDLHRECGWTKLHSAFTDAPDRVRPAAGSGSTTARRTASGNFRLPGIHPLLRVDAGRPVHCETQDTGKKAGPQVGSAPPGNEEAYAPAHRRATSLALPSVARPLRLLRLLRCASQLSCPERFPASSPANLVPRTATSQPKGPMPHLGPLQGPRPALHLADTNDHTTLGGETSMTWVTLGRSRVRESRTPGSVRAKAKWLSYSTAITMESLKRAVPT